MGQPVLTLFRKDRLMGGHPQPMRQPALALLSTYPLMAHSAPRSQIIRLKTKVDDSSSDELVLEMPVRQNSKAVAFREELLARREVSQG